MRRVVGLGVGKAAAFVYAVIVAVIGNLVFDYVRDMPRPVKPPAVAEQSGATAALMPKPTIHEALEPSEPAPAPVSLPQQASTPAIDPPSPPPAKPTATEAGAAPPPAPGPGNGGLY
jgi:hypothetical protein